MSAASAGRRDRPSGARAARRGLRPVPTCRRRRHLGRRFCWRPPGLVAHRLSGRADSTCRVAVGAWPRHGGPRRRVGCGKSLGSARGAWRGAGSGSGPRRSGLQTWAAAEGGGVLGGKTVQEGQGAGDVLTAPRSRVRAARGTRVSTRGLGCSASRAAPDELGVRN